MKSISNNINQRTLTSVMVDVELYKEAKIKFLKQNTTFSDWIYTNLSKYVHGTESPLPTEQPKIVTYPTDEDVQTVAKQSGIDLFRLRHEWEIKLSKYRTSQPQFQPTDYFEALRRLALELKGKEVTAKKKELFKEMKIRAWWELSGADMENPMVKRNIRTGFVWFADENGQKGTTLYEHLRSKHHGELPFWI